MRSMAARFTGSFAILAAFFALSNTAAWAEPVSSAGHYLEQTLESFDVEHHWPAGVHVNWETGNPDGRQERPPGNHTHCSAFVAAVAKRLNIYILRPPEHGQVLLANAQHEWLAVDGVAHGWNEILGPIEAQASANRGELVVATYRNHNDNKPGHIAIVRPSSKSIAAIRIEGPEITQAGGTNYKSTSLVKGFAGHPAAWGRSEIRYYAHIVKGQ